MPRSAGRVSVPSPGKAPSADPASVPSRSSPSPPTGARPPTARHPAPRCRTGHRDRDPAAARPAAGGRCGPGRRSSRVASRGESTACVLAGVPLSALLPAEVQAGDTLRLTVGDVDARARDAAARGRRQDPARPAAAAADERPEAVAVQEEPRTMRVGGEETITVALSFTSTALAGSTAPGARRHQRGGRGAGGPLVRARGRRRRTRSRRPERPVPAWRKRRAGRVGPRRAPAH